MLLIGFEDEPVPAALMRCNVVVSVEMDGTPYSYEWTSLVSVQLIVGIGNIPINSKLGRVR